MMYEEIVDWAEHQFEMGYRPVELIRSEFIELATSGGLSRSHAEREFGKIERLAKYKGKYISLTPQYDEGWDNGLEMLSVIDDGVCITYPDLYIERDCRNDIWHVYQYPEFEEDDPSNLRFVGDLEVAYHGPVWPILRTYCEDEANAALAAMLDESDKVWSTL